MRRAVELKVFNELTVSRLLYFISTYEIWYKQKNEHWKASEKL